VRDEQLELLFHPALHASASGALEKN
jgi:hypothetical protein